MRYYELYLVNELLDRYKFKLVDYKLKIKYL